MDVSPRISFSNDISQFDVVPVEKYIQPNSSSGVDFDFSGFRESFDRESSSADELFLDGKILPVEIKKRLAAPPKRAAEPPQWPPRPSPPPPQHDHKIDPTLNKDSGNSGEKQNSKSFWRFKRSSSLNCGGHGGGYGPSFCPLPLLSRSNSAGSATSSKRSSTSKYGFTHKQQKRSLFSNPTKQSQSVPSVSHQKPPLKNNNQGPYGINPVLNVPSASLFGLASIFSGGKEKNKNKK